MRASLRGLERCSSPVSVGALLEGRSDAQDYERLAPPQRVFTPRDCVAIQTDGVVPPRVEYSLTPLGRTPAAGVVAAADRNVSGFKIGDRVAYVVNGIGAYADAVLVPSEQLIALPQDIPTRLAAAICVNGMTAHYLLHEYRQVRSGVDVLIHGAAGGRGLMLIQWAKHLGARVIGTVSTEEKAKAAKEAGADDIILYSQSDFVTETKRLTNGKGVELVIDGVAKPTLPRSLQALAMRGTVVVYGKAGGAPDPIQPLSLIWGS